MLLHGSPSLSLGLGSGLSRATPILAYRGAGHHHTANIRSRGISQSGAEVGTGRLAEARPSRQRRRARTCEGFIFRYVYVHECGGANGFHSHILAHVPKEAVPDFAAWTRSTLPQLARHQGTKQTVKVVASQERDERGAVDRCWCWFRYLTKQLDERASTPWGLTLRCDPSGPCSR